MHIAAQVLYPSTPLETRTSTTPVHILLEDTWPGVGPWLESSLFHIWPSPPPICPTIWTMDVAVEKAIVCINQLVPLMHQCPPVCSVRMALAVKPVKSRGMYQLTDVCLSFCGSSKCPVKRSSNHVPVAALPPHQWGRWAWRVCTVATSSCSPLIVSILWAGSTWTTFGWEQLNSWLTKCWVCGHAIVPGQKGKPVENVTKPNPLSPLTRRGPN